MIDQVGNAAMTIGDTESFIYHNEDARGVIPLVPGDKVYFTANQGNAKIQKVVTSFTDGKAYFTLNPSDTKGRPIGVYTYDIQVTYKDGTVKTPIKNKKFELLGEQTIE
jgi:hypothetical protein